MDLSFRFDSWWKSLPASPKGSGTVEGLVLRPMGGPPGSRELPEVLRMNPREGIVGDRWVEDDQPRDAQVSLINVHVLRSLAGDLEAGAATGDNLQVDLALDEASLPVGTHLAVGSVILRVGSTPHRPCALFVERLGARAAKRVARSNRVGQRGRGVMCEVVVGGEVRVGDRIQVVVEDQVPAGE